MCSTDKFCADTVSGVKKLQSPTGGHRVRDAAVWPDELESAARDLARESLEAIEDRRGDVAIVEPRDVANTRRRRDVDLGQHAADHVEPDEDLAVLAQERRDCRDDLAIALVE